MIISTCGFGNTGASAVLDFLQGYPELQRIADFEFQLFHMPDGINDLKYHLTVSRERIACNCAVKRFERAAIHGRVGRMMKQLCGDQYVSLIKKYVNELIQVSWYGCSRYDPSDVTNRSQEGIRGAWQTQVNRVLRKTNHRFHYPAFQQRYLAIWDEQQFDQLTQSFFQSCLRAVGLDPDKDILMDVLFSAMNPAQGTEFVSNPKTILVFRDPRDMFIRANEHQATNGHTPCRDAEAFAVYYRSLMEHRIPSNDVLTVQYEELIYNYFPTTEKIMAFLGFKERPANEFEFFNPDISVKYTQAWKTYPGHETEKSIIEERLSKYLFSFSEYQKIEQQKELYKRENA